jgi:hypothetical protein
LVSPDEFEFRVTQVHHLNHLDKFQDFQIAISNALEYLSKFGSWFVENAKEHQTVDQKRGCFLVTVPFGCLEDVYWCFGSDLPAMYPQGQQWPASIGIHWTADIDFGEYKYLMDFCDFSYQTVVAIAYKVRSSKDEVIVKGRVVSDRSHVPAPGDPKWHAYNLSWQATLVTPMKRTDSQALGKCTFNPPICCVCFLQKDEETEGTLFKCDKCNAERYCSRECLETDHLRHRRVCKEKKVQREQAKQFCTDQKDQQIPIERSGGRCNACQTSHGTLVACDCKNLKYCSRSCYKSDWRAHTYKCSWEEIYSDHEDDEDEQHQHSVQEITDYQAVAMIANTQYMGGMLQILFLYEPFRRLILDEIDAEVMEFVMTVAIIRTAEAHMVVALHDLFQTLTSFKHEWEGNLELVAVATEHFVNAFTETLTPEDETEVLEVNNEAPAPSEPDNVGDFLRLLIGGILKAFKTAGETTATDTLVDIFHGTLKTQRKCRECALVTSGYEQFMMLNCHKMNTNSLEDTFEGLFAEQSVQSGHFCEQCQKETEAGSISRLDEAQLPGIIFMLLKENEQKNMKYSFPTQLDMGRYCTYIHAPKIGYNLKAVVMQDGSDDGNASIYTLVRVDHESETDKERWIKIDGETVEWFDRANIESINCSDKASNRTSAVMLAYNRIEFM